MKCRTTWRSRVQVVSNFIENMWKRGFSDVFLYIASVNDHGAAYDLALHLPE